VHALLGSVYAKTDRTQEAIAELKLALSDDKDGHIHYQIARLYLKVGDRNSANEAFEISTRLRSEGLNRAAVSMQQTPTEEESQ
jgi:tetratricopeptide (TPR) repeat protein